MSPAASSRLLPTVFMATLALVLARPSGTAPQAAAPRAVDTGEQRADPPRDSDRP